MKVLLDACVWGGAADVLTTAGHDVEAVAAWPKDPGDAEILDRAFHASQVVLTIDKDFGELAVVRRQAEIIRELAKPPEAKLPPAAEFIQAVARELRGLKEVG